MSDSWKHRSKGMKCRTCMFFVVKPNEYEESVLKEITTSLSPPPSNLGRCRRHAPTMSGFPAVFMDDWCGDHKLDENKI